MDILKREIAPISKDAWREIDNKAKDVIENILSARRVLKLNGPKGWNYTAVPEGRLIDLDKADKNSEIGTGIYKLKNLIEARVSFELNRWELDNVERGAKDIDLDALEKACEDLAMFEENAIYNGYKKGNIQGLTDAAFHKIKFGKDGNEILKSISQGKYALLNSYIEGPYDLVVSTEVYDRLNTVYEGAHLMELAQKIIEGEIIRSKAVNGAILIPHRDKDIEFTVGQDFAIGFEGISNKTVRLFITESFTLRVLEEKKIVAYSV